MTRFLTLTLDPKKIPKDIEPEKYIKYVWAKFRVYLKRKLGKTVEYIAVMEYHKSGIPHLHALVDQFIPQPWIKSSWSRLGGGTIVHIEKLPNDNKIAAYMGKYFSKSVILSAPKRARRYMTSRGIKLLKRYVHTGQQELFEIDKPSGWEIMDRSIEEYFAGAGKNVLKEEMDEQGAIRYFVSPEAVKDLRV